MLTQLYRDVWLYRETFEERPILGLERTTLATSVRAHLGQSRPAQANWAAPLPLNETNAVYSQAEKNTPKAVGYLDLLPDFTNVLPPAPVIGDLRDDLDRAMFRATRSLALGSR